MHNMQLLFQREICFLFSSHSWFAFLVHIFKIYIKHPLGFEHRVHKPEVSAVLNLLKFIFWKIGIFLGSFGIHSIAPAWQNITKNTSLVWLQMEVYLLLYFFLLPLSWEAGIPTYFVKKY